MGCWSSVCGLLHNSLLPNRFGPLLSTHMSKGGSEDPLFWRPTGAVVITLLLLLVTSYYSYYFISTTIYYPAGTDSSSSFSVRVSSTYSGRTHQRFGLGDYTTTTSWSGIYQNSGIPPFLQSLPDLPPGFTFRGRPR